MTSGGWDITSLANASTSSPLVGSMSSRFLLGLRQKLRVLHRFVKSLAEDFDMLGTHIGRREIGAMKLSGGEQRRRQSPRLLRGFVLIHQLEERRCVG